LLSHVLIEFHSTLYMKCAGCVSSWYAPYTDAY